MTTSLETIKALITKMQQEFNAVASSNLQDNRRHFDETGLKTVLPNSIHIETVSLNQNITADWLIPKNYSEKKIILYVHGGGFSVGSSLSHRAICSRIADSSNCKILSINYRLAPEHKFPTALDDVLFSYQWLLEHYPTKSIVMIGDSAGGGLVMSALLAIRERHLPMPVGAVGISAWLDLECTSKSYQSNKEIDLLASAEGLRFVGRGYANKKINIDPLASAFYAKNLVGLCPLLIQIGSAETLLDENVAFAELAKKDGVNVDLQIWPNMVHVWHSLYGLIPESKQAIDAIADWIKHT